MILIGISYLKIIKRLVILQIYNQSLLIWFESVRDNSYADNTFKTII